MGIDGAAMVGIMCRNHRGIIEAILACSKVGADILYLDPDGTPSALGEGVGLGVDSPTWWSATPGSLIELDSWPRTLSR
jgi:hypothetical protein